MGRAVVRRLAKKTGELGHTQTKTPLFVLQHKALGLKQAVDLVGLVDH